MQVIFKTTPHTRSFGVELEVSPNIHKKKIGLLLEDYEMFYGRARSVRVTSGTNGWEETNRNAYWHVKYDSTCGPVGKGHDSGWEIASFIGRTEEDLDHIAGAAEWLGERGLSTNTNCGYHIHVDISDFSPERVGLMLARWLNIEFHIMAATAKHRLTNPYCQLLWLRRIALGVDYDPQKLKAFWNRMAPVNLNPHDNLDKRYTVNTVGYRAGQVDPFYPRKTVEFRFPECLLQRDHVANWVRLLLCFVEECRLAEEPPKDVQRVGSMVDALRIIGLQSESDFYLLDEKLSATKFWFLQKVASECKTEFYGEEAAKLLAFIGQL